MVNTAQILIVIFTIFNMSNGYNIASSPPPLKKRGGVEDFWSRDICGGLALISGFWGDLEKRGE